MPPALPERYVLEVRLGRDHDVEEWLATDTALDRPVLIRVLGPETTPERRDGFLRSVRGAAAVPHVHLAAIYAAGLGEDGAYSISEWAGGMTLADRAGAGEPIEPEEFLPNAAGLAEALAALHAAGQVHGRIDQSAIFFSAAHPAKIGSFGRPGPATAASDDVRNLAQALETSLTGRPAGAVPPSQVVDRLSPAVDRALADARAGHADAPVLARSLHAAPTITPPEPSRDWNWRWLIPVGVLVVVASILVAFGSSLVTGTPDDASAGVPLPTLPEPTASVDAGPAPTTSPDPAPDPSVPEPGTLRLVAAASYDPYGDQEEHDELAAAAIDGDFETVWRTESYLDPLPLLKEGVGLAVTVTGTPAAIEVAGVRNGTAWSLHWADTPPGSIDDWTPVANGTVRNGRIEASLQPRRDGTWLIWLTDLPATNDGTYGTTIGEVRFRP